MLTFVGAFLEQFEFCVCLYSKGNSILEVDDEGGRMFLRVLTHLTMHDYPPLVSGALQLLFRHFSQRQEVLHTFKQVHTYTQTYRILMVLTLKVINVHWL